MNPAPLTDEQMRDALRTCPHDTVENLRVRWLYAKDFARTIEAARDQQWQEMLAKQEPVVVIGSAWTLLWAGGDSIETIVKRHGLKIGTKLFATPPNHTAVMRQALEALQYFDDYVQPLTNKFGGPKVAQPASTSWHVHKAIDALKQALGDAQ